TPGTRTHRGLRFCCPLRLTSFVCASAPGSRTPGGYGSVARFAGSRRLYVPLPRFEDSPGATLCHPLRGLTSFVCASPPVRGLTGGYVVSPAARADVVCMCLCPRFEDSPGDTVLSPASRARGSTQNSELRTSSGRGAQLLQQLKCFVRNETPKARAKQRNARLIRPVTIFVLGDDVA